MLMESTGIREIDQYLKTLADAHTKIEEIQQCCEHQFLAPDYVVADDQLVADHADLFYTESNIPGLPDRLKDLIGRHSPLPSFKTKCLLCEKEVAFAVVPLDIPYENISTPRKYHCPKCLNEISWFAFGNLDYNDRMRIFGYNGPGSSGYDAIYLANCHNCGSRYVTDYFEQ